MRAFVFSDKSLSRQAGRFVWLEIDTEKAQNAPLRKKFPMPALPSFFVVDPDSERVALRWVGGATVAQLDKILDDGRAAVAAAHGNTEVAGGTSSAARMKPATSPADAGLARADRLYGEAKNAEAAKAYQEAIAAAPEGWPRYARAVESLLFAWSQCDSNEAVAELARDAYPKLRHTASAANVAASGLDGALGLPENHPQRKVLVAALEADCLEVVGDPKLRGAADDRSAVYLTLVDARKDAKDDAGAKEMAGRWAAFLDGEAARAKNPGARAVFDSHRLTAYLAMGEPERAVTMLQASERDWPDDYNPPARLADAYKAMKRWDEALAASDRALAKVYGPRKLRVLQVRAEIYMGRTEPAMARSTLEEALRFAEALPPGQKSESTIASLQKKIAALSQP
jgi:tetratricopeptide (TPR) repeat protein